MILYNEVTRPSNLFCFQKLRVLETCTDACLLRGMFIFSDPAIPGDCYGMFEAYPPTKVHRTAYEYSGFLNDELLVDLIPLSELSPYLLRNDSWNYWDSALYIIPDCTQTRSAFSLSVYS